MTYSGTGTLTLGGTDSYAGTTAATSGTLNIGASGSLTGSTTVAVSSGATFAVASGGSILSTTNLTDNARPTSMNRRPRSRLSAALIPAPC